MKERPILFSPAMIRKILSGEKSQTRRVAKPEEVLDLCGDAMEHGAGLYSRCPYGAPGDRLWVREGWTGTWHQHAQGDIHIHYRADGGERFVKAPEGYVLPKVAAKPGKFVTSLFMPRWASRITLEITEVRMQRVKSISEEDALAEGVEPVPVTPEDVADMEISDAPPHIKEMARILGVGKFTAKFEYQVLWDSLNAKRGDGEYAWKKDPWVWCLSFGRVL